MLVVCGWGTLFVALTIDQHPYMHTPLQSGEHRAGRGHLLRGLRGVQEGRGKSESATLSQSSPRSDLRFNTHRHHKYACMTTNDTSIPSQPHNMHRQQRPNTNQKQKQDRAIVQKDLDLKEWWTGVRTRARDMRKRQMDGGISAKRGGFLPAQQAFVAASEKQRR